MFFGSWHGMLRMVVVGSAAYVALVLLLRIAGKRSLAKLNAFDFVVTIALGSTLSSVVLDSSIPLSEGVAALVLLLLLQLLVSWSSARSRWFERVTRAAPALVFYRGRILGDALRRARLTEGDVHSAIRRARVGSLDRVEAVVLETSGDLSVVLEARAAGERSSLASLSPPDEARADLGAKLPARRAT